MSPTNIVLPGPRLRLLTLSSGVVVIIDRDLKVLSRSWCLFEAGACVRDSDLTSLKVGVGEPTIAHPSVKIAAS